MKEPDMATRKTTAKTEPAPEEPTAPGDEQEQPQEAPAADEDTSTPDTPPETVTDDEGSAGPAKPKTTKGRTFQEAAKDATPSTVGYVGTSPERERTGMDDKGLSLANPAIVSGKGQVPDPRRGVDDSDALKD